MALVVLGRWARLDFLPPSLRARLPWPASESPLVRGFLSVKRLPAYGSVNFVSLTSQKRTLGGDVYGDPRATEAPLLLSEGASHGAALRRSLPPR